MESIGLLMGFEKILNLQNLGFAFIGALLGTLVGVLPGLGPASAIALLFPLLGHLPPVGAIIMLAGIYQGSQYGGSTTSILVNVPGEMSSIVTCFDGYAMTKQGRPGPALAISAIGSFIAATIAMIALTFSAPLLANAAIIFGPPEYFGLYLLSLTSIIGFSGGSIFKGLLTALFGLFLTLVGVDPMSGVIRLTFKIPILSGGLDIVPVFIGLFGITEALSQLEETIDGTVKKIGRLMPTWEELKRGIFASLRGGLLGTALGVLPGMSPSIGSFLSYDLEKRISKHPEKFGTGMIEGIAGPEAANNGTSISGMIPMMSLGIPTCATLALVLAALVVYGVQPGPLMFSQHAEMAWSVIASLYIGNLMLLILNLPLVGLWARLSLVPSHIMAGAVIVLCTIASWVNRFSMFDCWLMFIFGLIGYYMRKKNWPPAPLVLGFIIGPMTEQSLRQTISMYGGNLLGPFSRPLFVCLFIGALVSLFFGFHMQRRATVMKD